ncbi:MFS transporter, partial [Mesorhizobium sp.]|uniref:MFS transporter n=1 Tax=Mesorhizobium sp. TaxID=1871066 RepID=UPI001229665C
IARIMITWGLISAGFMFTASAPMFYLLRFLLGVAEAGFYPGIILFLTYWYPSHRRAKIIAIFMSAIPISGIFGNPLSGWIMDSFHGSNGLAGWQQAIEREIAQEEHGKERSHSVAGIFRDPRIWLMCLIYFCFVMGQYGLTFWMPTLVKATGVAGNLNIGLISAIPFICAVIAMNFFGRSADRY